MWKDCETELDFLDFDYLIETLDMIISDNSLLPSSIGVYGDWGSGKSSLIRMIMRKYEKDSGTVCLNFNGWLFESYDDAKTALIGSILDKIKENRTLGENALRFISGLYKSIDKLKLLKYGAKYGADFLLTGGIGTLTEIGIKGILSNLKTVDHEKIIDVDKIKENIEFELDDSEVRKDIKKFQSDFSELLKETKIDKLIIFVDELDRCSPDTILDTLEAIRLFLFTGNTVFIVGADERHISYAVKKKFDNIEGIKIDIGKEYLEKIIQYPIRIPRLNKKEVEFYITCLLFQKDLNDVEFKEVIKILNEEKNNKFLDFELSIDSIKGISTKISDKVKDSLIVAKQLSSVLANGLNGNPRHCKRFLNSLTMREKMAKYKNINLDRKVLAKIMMLEYFKPGLFRKIADQQFSSMGKNEELLLLEEKKYQDLKDLKDWQDDSWVQDWCKITPSLGKKDLRSYFYFSRESLDDKFDTNSIKLSPNAEKILQSLLSKAELLRNSAIKDSSIVNDLEASQILLNVYNNMLSESSIDKGLFYSFIEWGKTRKDLFSQMLNYLKSIPGDRILSSFIPFVKGINDNEPEIKEILNKWEKENSKLTRAINSSLSIEGE